MNLRINTIVINRIVTFAIEYLILLYKFVIMMKNYGYVQIIGKNLQ